MVQETEERQETREEKGGVGLGMLAFIGLIAWYFWPKGGNGNGNGNGNGQAQFTGLKAGYLGEKSSPYIVKHPGDSWGAAITFQHKGKGGAFWTGIGMAYGELVGHNPPFAYAMKTVNCTDDTDWKSYSVACSATVSATVIKETLIDCQRFISNAQPIVGQQPPNPYGVNNWDDEIYVVREEFGPETFQQLTVSYI